MTGRIRRGRTLGGASAGEWRAKTGRTGDRWERCRRSAAIAGAAGRASVVRPHFQAVKRGRPPEGSPDSPNSTARPTPFSPWERGWGEGRNAQTPRPRSPSSQHHPPPPTIATHTPTNSTPATPAHNLRIAAYEQTLFHILTNTPSRMARTTDTLQPPAPPPHALEAERQAIARIITTLHSPPPRVAPPPPLAPRLAIDQALLP